MAEKDPVAELAVFSSDDAVSTEWAQARGDLRDAEVYWLTTVRLLYRVTPSTAFGFGKGRQFSQTRWCFS
jgi:hypothetical protein